MSEETQTEKAPEQTSQPEYSEVELQAMEMGWRPKEQFEQDPKNAGKRWRPADLFLDVQPLYERIESQTKQLRNNEKALNEVIGMFQNVKQQSYQEALKQLKEQKATAIRESDADAVVEIDEKIDQLKESAKVPQRQVNQVDPQITSWIEKNTWYSNDADLREFADFLGAKYASQGKQVEEALPLIEQTVKKQFPDKFQNTRKIAPPMVESKTEVSTQKSSKEPKLSKMEEEIMGKVLRTMNGKMTREEYIKQLVALREKE